jgi:16S rRNA (cytosine1402-N4)-methyltransferase
MHVPVLQKEVIKYLDPKPNENFIDCTIGQAGHSLAILEKTVPNGKVLGIDLSQESLERINGEYKDRLILICDNFINLKNIVEKLNFGPVSGILLDLGMSSWHLEESGKGFSFLRKEFLDMRYNSKNPQTAEKIIKYWSKNDIEKILTEYGEEQFAKIIANEIIKTRKARPIKTTFELVEIIRKAVHGWYRRQKIHFATRTFQALRIAVNDELNNLKKVLPQTIDILKPGGRLVIISFHSLEDRIAKSFFSAFVKGYGGQERKLEILTKKPVRPSTEELNSNPRSRSARLRAVIKI